MQDTFYKKRKEYLNGKISHEDFYCWLADSIKLTIKNVPFSMKQLWGSKDENLNDLPLAIWDSRDGIVRRYAISHGMRSWSLCETVCCLKAIAKRELKK